MSRQAVEPEYILKESVKTHLTEKQLACLSQTLFDLEVDSAVLHKELCDLATMSGRIGDSIRKVRQQLQEDT